MATSSVVGYIREDGKVRGTYVHNDGHPGYMLNDLWVKLQELGFEGIKEWIDKGVEGQGYSTVYSEPYNDGYEPWLKNIDEELYGYIVTPKGIVATQDNLYIDSVGEVETNLIDEFKLSEDISQK